MFYVRLRKCSAADTPDCGPGEWATYPVGKVEPKDLSLPVGYDIEGWLVNHPIVGGHAEVLRISRNGIACPGHFVSSKIVEILADGFRTRNSIYKVTVTVKASVGRPLSEDHMSAN